MPDQAGQRTLRILTYAFFAALLLVGIAVYRDYGITWDEFPTREFGILNVFDVVHDRASLDTMRAARGPAFERFGPFVEIQLVRLEAVQHARQLRDVFFMRHLVNFLIFVAGVACFNVFCRRRFGRGIALLASICLATSPQLFSHAFYNVKDIAFLTMFVASMLTLDTMLAHQTWRTMLGHAVVTGVLIGTRILGIFTMLLTGAAALAKRPSWRTFGLLVAYGVVVAAILPLVWPVLRIDPIGIVKDAVLGATTNPYTKTDLFRGQQLDATKLPWDYMPTWMLITTPLVITALFLLGSARTFMDAVRAPREFIMGDRQRDTLVLAWFFLPLGGTVILRPIMYDGWRHLFFIYPAAIYLAAAGMQWIAEWAVGRQRPVSDVQDADAVVADAGPVAARSAFDVAVLRRTRMIHAVLVLALFAGLAPAVSFMVKNHPYESLYFNRFAGKDMAEIKQKYELDYWGLSYRELLEHILRVDPSPVIRIHPDNFPGVANASMLTREQRARIQYVGWDANPDYFITNYRYHAEPFPFPNDVYDVRVGNAAIASVFKLRPTP